LAALTLQGDGAEAVLGRALGAAPAAGKFARHLVGDAEVLVAARRRSRSGGFDLHLLARQLPEVVGSLQRAGAKLAGERALTLARVLAGVPSVEDEGAAGSLPQELGLADALSLDKGCYLGQEIMARIDARGNVRKGLARLRLEGDPEALAALAAGDERALRAGDREVGRLGTVVQEPHGSWRALAVVRRDHPADVALTLGDVRAWFDPVEAASA